MSKLKHYIDEFLDPSKVCYVDNLTVNEALKFLNIAEVDYYVTLSLSATSDYEIHLCQPRNSCFFNSYNPIMLTAWRASIDIQPVSNQYKAVSYMSAYFSKSESETSKALLQACIEIRSTNLQAR